MKDTIIYEGPCKTKYLDEEEIMLVAMSYQGNDRLALQAYSSTEGEPLFTATVNLPDEELEPDEILIKDYSENEGVFQFLLDKGIIEKQTGVALLNYGFAIKAKLSNATERKLLA